MQTVVIQSMLYDWGSSLEFHPQHYYYSSGRRSGDSILKFGVHLQEYSCHLCCHDGLYQNSTISASFTKLNQESQSYKQ